MMNQRSETQPDIRIGHVNLRVSDLERATAFYRDVLGSPGPRTDPTSACPERLF
jgi:catechol-2,3-dioxygenase